MTNPPETKLEAVAFQQVVRRLTGDIVGYRYRWNDGSVQILWCKGRVSDVIFVDLPEVQYLEREQSGQRQ